MRRRRGSAWCLSGSSASGRAAFCRSHSPRPFSGSTRARSSPLRESPASGSSASTLRASRRSMAARYGFKLPYFLAEARAERHDSWISFDGRRRDSRGPPAAFRARYRPSGRALEPELGSLAHFLTERYCLYTVASDGRLLRAEIHHRAVVAATGRSPDRGEHDAAAGPRARGRRPAPPFLRPTGRRSLADPRCLTPSSSARARTGSPPRSPWRGQAARCSFSRRRRRSAAAPAPPS